MINLFKRKKWDVQKEGNKERNQKECTIILRCGEREIIGDEYNTLAQYNRRMHSTEFGKALFYKMMNRYGKCQRVYGRDDGIEYAYDFGNESNLISFVKECRRYLKLD